jgi:hypothetical protein
MKVLVAVSSSETWMGVGGWIDAQVKACHFNMLFHTYHR